MRFFHSSRSPLFGRKITPACSYCAHAAGDGSCTLHRVMKNGKCSRYSYDPLLRSPKTAPPVPEHDAEEFSL